MTSFKPEQVIIKIVHDELVELLGGQNTRINLYGKPATILI
ncbi:MAG: hypothetical protein ACFIN2_01290 [Candidatus Walczuchella monophlebidarum]